MPYSICQCAAAGYRVLDLNFCEAMNPHSRLRDDDWESYVDEIGELGAKLGVCYTQSHSAVLRSVRDGGFRQD